MKLLIGFKKKQILSFKIKENKQEIINKVVDKVSNKIIVTKQIKDFKKSIMEI